MVIEGTVNDRSRITVCIEKQHNQGYSVGKIENETPPPSLSVFHTGGVYTLFEVTVGTRYSRMDQVKFFKSCLPQILLGSFLNTLS